MRDLPEVFRRAPIISSIKALAAHSKGAPLEPFEFELPELGAEEVEIEVEYCGICHSDLSMFQNRGSEETGRALDRELARPAGFESGGGEIRLYFVDGERVARLGRHLGGSGAARTFASGRRDA